MFGNISKKFRQAFDNQIDGTGLAIFRIVFTTILLFEILQLFYFRQLAYDVIPYILPAEVDFTIPLIIWMITCVLLIIGLFTRTASIINYLFTIIFFATCKGYIYHMFYVFQCISMLFMFLPISRVLSIDNLLLKLKYSNTRFVYSPPATVSQMSYFIPVLVGIAFVYFDSTLHKLVSPTWLRGLGMWAPASLPYVVHLDTSWLLNIKWLAILLGYVSMVFEFVFLFLFPLRKFRVILTIIGIGFHLGILVQFPIPFFALGFGSLYLLMVPVGFWKRINFNKHSVKKLTLYYDAECPLCARTKIIIEHFDISNRIQFLSVQQHARQNPALNSVSDDELLDNIYSVDTKGNIYQGIDTYVQVLNAITYLKPLSWFTRMPGIYHLGKIVYAFVANNRTTERCTEDNCGYDPPSPPADDRDFKVLKGISLHHIKMYGVAIGLCFLITLQCIVSYNSPAVWYARKYSGLNNTTVGAILGRVSDKTTTFSRTFFGILNHNVFMDFHMAHYNRIVAVTYIDKQGVEHFLPITRPSGQPGFYQYGPFWAHWAFQVVTPTPIQPMVEKGVMDYTAFWAGKNNVDLNHFIFRVKVKRIDDLNGWQPNFLKRQMAKRWQDAGYIEWKGYKFTSHIKPISSF